MVTAPKISRAQLAKICGNDHDMIRQFETLFSTAGGSSYVHPIMDGYKHLPVTGTTSAGKVPIAGATAGEWTLGQPIPASHTHAISDTTGLQDALDAKAAASHSHAASAVSGIQAAANQRQTVTLTLSAATGTANLGKTFEILDETASAAGRFRLYRTTAGRDADLARSVEVQEPNTVGLLLEDVFTDSALAVAEDPAPCSAGADGLCAWSWSGELGSTVTLTILVKEA